MFETMRNDWKWRKRWKNVAIDFLISFGWLGSWLLAWETRVNDLERTC